jgi:ribose transport system ATP-binding protein
LSRARRAARFLVIDWSYSRGGSLRRGIALSEIIRVEHLSKSFPGTRALIDVDLDIRAGEVHALVGHNGSGKSTLIKVLSGYHTPDPGAAVYLDGREVSFGELAHGRHGHGTRMNFVHQDLGLVLELNTIDNLALHGGFTRTRIGRVHWREQIRRARELMAPFDSEFDVTQPLSHVTPVERTIVAVAGALQGWRSGHGVLVLDEPTAVLPPNEVGRLFGIVRQLRDGGAGILYVSHRLDEVFELADRVTVLRNGERVITRDVAGLTNQQLVEHMLGEDARAHYRADIAPPAADRPLLAVRGLTGRYLRGATFDVHPGEVLGIAGLPSDGRDELPRLITDSRRLAEGGEVRTAEDGAEWVDIRRWSGAGVVILPPDRARHGILSAMSVGENLSLSALDQLGPATRLVRRREQDFVRHWIDTLDVKTAGPDAPITTLSGGNQQKVLFGRVLAVAPRVLVMCEPTAGVDIGARQAIYELVAAQVREGLGVVLVSSDVGDLEALCTRVLVLREGVVVDQLRGERLNEHELLHAMEGVQPGVGT